MAPFTKTDVIWMNGELVPWAEANVHVSAHALQYGTGVFEGMRSYDTPDGPAIFRLEPHMKRLVASASYYELAIPYSVEELCDAALDVLRSNHLDNAYFRPLAFFDSHSFSVWPRDCPVSVAIISVPGRAYLQGGPEHGVRVTVSTVKRIESSTLPPHIKASGHYTNSVLAVQEAIRRGYDDALLFNAKGDISEGSGANLMIVRNGTLITNDVDASILPGITRDSVLQIARDLSIPSSIRAMSLADVQTADEVFFCGTDVEVTPIREIDGRMIGNGRPGPITQRIQRTFYEAAHGRLPHYKRWLTTAAPLLELAK